MTKRLRVVSFQVMPVLMVDDGDQLEALPVQPVSVSAADWPNVHDLLADAIGRLRTQVEQEG